MAQETNTPQDPAEHETPQASEQTRRKRAGIVIQKIGLVLISAGFLGLILFVVWERYLPAHVKAALHPDAEEAVAFAGGGAYATATAEPPLVALSPLATPSSLLQYGISRNIDFKTIIPSRPRVEVITYTVQPGDTLFSIALKFGLKPETVLWGNFEVLEDNPHLLKPNQVLNILPVDGTYYQWKEGDNLNDIAAFFKVEPEAILNYPGNHFDLTEVLNGEINITPGTWLIVPGGKRAIKDWGPPAITRQNPASARYYGEGHCGDVYEGAYGTGTFIWPTTERTLSGYTYDPGVHPAIDIGGQEGNPVYASDSGVVVYAGWSNYGYGYLIVIDHGNGWQTAYAHLSAVAVSCGQSVYQGGYIGALGSTGNSSGPHLHFEMVYNGVKVNPLDYLR